ncbi:MAG TPA: LPS export ABC transporter permease LptF [Candidatus Competibacteraceae bacterium]|nr:LPS export ABC transporter permease LptF [Candidatus Competibacteraceae bacterium]
MLTRIDRYLIKETLLTFLATVVVLLAMVLSHRLALYLSQAAGGLLARDAIFLLLGLQAVRFLVVLVPLALLLSVMLTLGRLYRDSEMTALTACGIGPGAVYRALYWLGVPLALMLALLSLYVLPRCMALQFEIQDRARQDAELSIFKPGVFREVADGRHVVYVGRVEDNGRALEEIFVRSQLREGLAVTSARHGRQEFDLERGTRYIVLNDGYRYEGTPGGGDYRSVHFRELRLRLDSVPEDRNWRRRETIPTAELWNTNDRDHAAELHTRLSGPVSLLVVLFLAPLLARAHPREGRYGRVVAAILLYVIYFNLLGIGEAKLKSGQVWLALGLWWVHALIALFGVGLWWYHYGRRGSRGGRLSEAMA